MMRKEKKKQKINSKNNKELIWGSFLYLIIKLCAMIVAEIKSKLDAFSDLEKAKIYSRFFKTGKGEYGEGDTFIGVTVPNQRLIAKEYFTQISLNEISDLLKVNIHEYRLIALIMLVYQFEKTKDSIKQKEIVDFYLKHTRYINNWDLVDTSSYKIFGRYCYENHQDEILFQLAESDNMWEKRIAIVSTMYHIKKDQLDITPQIVLKNMNHPHDLMHKANGWLLREMGKRNEQRLIDFLDNFTTKLPRTSLRYAIEKLTPAQRKYYMELK